MQNTMTGQGETLYPAKRQQSKIQNNFAGEEKIWQDKTS
jgi:hypothetical protein